MFELIEAYGLLGIQHFASLILGFVRTKILATTLGPAGVGIVGQANSFFMMMQGISTLGMGGGFIKGIAEQRSQEDYQRLNRMVITVVSVYAACGLFLLVLSALIARPVARWAFGDPAYASLIVILVAAGGFWVQYQVINFLFRGLFHFREYTLTATLGYGINILIVIPMVYLGGVNGAVFSFLIAQIVNLFIAGFVLHRYIVPVHQLRYWRYKPDWNELKILLQYVAPSISVQFFATFAAVYIRGEIIRSLGADANGFFQASWSMSLAYMGFITNAIPTYGVPKAATLLSDATERVRLQNNGLRVSLLLITPVTLLLLSLREIWIPVLYSREFLVAGSLLVWQFSADILRIIRQNMNVVLLPLGKLAYLFLDGGLFWGGWIFLSLITIPRFGIVGVPMAYFIINLAMVGVGLAYHHWRTGFNIYPGNQRLIFKIIFLLILGYSVSFHLQPFFLQAGLNVILLLVMLVWLPTRMEKEKAVTRLRQILERSSPRS